MSFESFPTVPYGEKPPENFPNEPPNIGNRSGYRFSETLRYGAEAGRTLRGMAKTSYRSRGAEGTNKALREIEEQQGVNWEENGKFSEVPPVEKVAFFNEQSERINATNSLIEEAYQANLEGDEDQAGFFYEEALESVSRIIQDQIIHDHRGDGAEFAERMMLLLSGLKFRSREDENLFRKEAKKRAFESLRGRTAVNEEK